MNTTLTPEDIVKLQALIEVMKTQKPSLAVKEVFMVPVMTSHQIKGFLMKEKGTHVFLPFPDSFVTLLDSLPIENGQELDFELLINSPSAPIADHEIFEALSGRCFSTIEALSAICFLINRHLEDRTIKVSQNTIIFCVQDVEVRRKFYLQFQSSGRWMVCFENGFSSERWPFETSVCSKKVSTP